MNEKIVYGLNKYDDLEIGKGGKVRGGGEIFKKYRRGCGNLSQRGF